MQPTVPPGSGPVVVEDRPSVLPTPLVPRTPPVQHNKGPLLIFAGLVLVAVSNVASVLSPYVAREIGPRYASVGEDKLLDTYTGDVFKWTKADGLLGGYQWVKMRASPFGIFRKE